MGQLLATHHATINKAAVEDGGVPAPAGFGLLDDAPAEHAALTGNLLLATTTPAPDGDNPLWLAIDLDGPRLAALLATLDSGQDS